MKKLPKIALSKQSFEQYALAISPNTPWGISNDKPVTSTLNTRTGIHLALLTQSSNLPALQQAIVNVRQSNFHYLNVIQTHIDYSQSDDGGMSTLVARKAKQWLPLYISSQLDSLSESDLHRELFVSNICISREPEHINPFIIPRTDPESPESLTVIDNLNLLCSNHMMRQNSVHSLYPDQKPTQQKAIAPFINQLRYNFLNQLAHTAGHSEKSQGYHYAYSNRNQSYASSHPMLILSSATTHTLEKTAPIAVLYSNIIDTVNSMVSEVCDSISIIHEDGILRLV